MLIAIIVVVVLTVALGAIYALYQTSNTAGTLVTEVKSEEKAVDNTVKADVTKLEAEAETEVKKIV